MQFCAVSGRIQVKGEHASFERREHLLREPRSKHRTLSSVSSLQALDTDFELKYGDCRDIELTAFSTLRPANDCSVRERRTGFAQFGDNIRVKEVQILARNVGNFEGVIVASLRLEINLGRTLIAQKVEDVRSTPG